MPKTLFEFAGRGMKAQVAVKKLCHRDNPTTSFEAAEKMIKTGELSRQEQEVLDAIKMYLVTKPRTHETLEALNFTTKDIALRMAKGLHAYFKCYDICRRRFSGLREKGKIERIKIGISPAGKPIYKKRDGCCVCELVRN